MPSDAELAKIAWMAFVADDGWSEDEAAAYWDDGPPNAPLKRAWADVARAVCTALLPDVAPLAPGELIVTQTSHVRLTVCAGSEPGWMEISTDQMATRPATVMEIDAAGVAALREACARWLAAQESE